MANLSITLRVLGCEIQIQSRAPVLDPIVQWLEDDFRAADSVELIHRKLSIDLQTEPIEMRGLPWIRLPRVQVFGWGYRKHFQFINGVRASIDFRDHRKAVFSSATAENLYETVYLFILSTVGEWLEGSGWIRLHALSGEFRGQPFCVLAQPGFGKSLTAARLGEYEGFRLGGDEIVLIKNRDMVSFPLRLALGIEVARLFNIPSSNRFLYAGGLPHKKVLLAAPEGIYSQNNLPIVLIARRRADRWRVLGPLRFGSFVDIVLGRGLPQMLEYLVRWDYLPSLFRLVFGRVKFLLSYRRVALEVEGCADPNELSELLTKLQDREEQVFYKSRGPLQRFRQIFFLND